MVTFFIFYNLNSIQEAVEEYEKPEYLDRVKLISQAEYVLNVEPKVNSTAIREMRQEVKKILEYKELWKNQ